MGAIAMSNPVSNPRPRIDLPIAPDRRRQDRVLARMPIHILGIDGHPVGYLGCCTNLSRGGIGFETTARIEVGKIVEFEFAQVVDEPVRYWLRILFRDNCRYGGYYVNDDGSDIRFPN